MKDMTIRDLDAATLAAVVQLAPDAYGVTIRERVGELLAGDTPSTGTMHQVLTKLERRRLLHAHVGDSTPVRGGRAKRLFTLTAAGARALDQARRTAEQRAAAFATAHRSG